MDNQANASDHASIPSFRSALEMIGIVLGVTATALLVGIVQPLALALLSLCGLGVRWMAKRGRA